MSYSSLWGIKPNYIGTELTTYSNSWLFSPTIMNVLSEKYAPELVFSDADFKKSIFLPFGGEKIWIRTNDMVNHCNDISDRICWELANLQIFSTHDQKLVADSIRQFVLTNQEYDKFDNDNQPSLAHEHIIERFHKIADDIESLNAHEYPYFVFKSTSCDDNVEYWFRSYDEELDKYVDKSLADWEKAIAEFVIIKDGSIEKFVCNLDFKYI